ncbi:MAG: hypothetical protein LBJ61_01040 [Deltaproteobacteria bacterium]|jgi:hypothetical protein|nr:hypothetical protein [Deltaproteobacteria bacterium]
MNYSNLDNQRDAEEFLVQKCLDAAFEPSAQPENEFEGNLCYLASTMVHSHYPEQSSILLKKSDDFFKSHSEKAMDLDKVAFDFGVVSLSRFRATLLKFFYFKVLEGEPPIAAP